MPASAPDAGDPAARAAAALTWSTPPETSRAVSSSVDLTWSGVQSGCCSKISAATPETTGAAIEVPPMRM